MNPGLDKNCYLQTIHLQIMYLIYIDKQDLTQNNLQGLICCIKHICSIKHNQIKIFLHFGNFGKKIEDLQADPRGNRLEWPMWKQLKKFFFIIHT